MLSDSDTVLRYIYGPDLGAPILVLQRVRCRCGGLFGRYLYAFAFVSATTPSPASALFFK